MKSPYRLVSIIIPAFNVERFVGRAIRSVLSQTYPAVEAMVVDDGSTDGTSELVDAIAAKHPRVRVVHQANSGLAAARNTGLENTRGEFVGFLDSDDWMLAHKIKRQVAALEGLPEVDFVYSDYQKVYDESGRPGKVFGGIPPVPFLDALVYCNWIGMPTPLLRRRLTVKVGAFDTELTAAEDWDYWYRCAGHTAFHYDPGVVAMYRVHKAQMTQDNKRMLVARLQFAAKHFSRDRQKWRSNMTAFHLEQAVTERQRGNYLACAVHLWRYATMANSVEEAVLVWHLVRGDETKPKIQA